MPTLFRMSAMLVSVLCFAQGQKFITSHPSNMTAPSKAKVETVIDDYHGHKVADPYRWLENSTSPDTQRFVEEQNAYTRQVLDAIPGRDKLRARIEQMVTIGRVESPRVRGHYYFYERRAGRENQPIVYVREGLHGKDWALVDVNALAPDGTIALDWWFPSHDGKYVAYGTSPNGSEISTLKVIETASGKLLAEQIDVALPEVSGRQAVDTRVRLGRRSQAI